MVIRNMTASARQQLSKVLLHRRKIACSAQEHPVREMFPEFASDGKFASQLAQAESYLRVLAVALVVVLARDANSARRWLPRLFES